MSRPPPQMPPRPEPRTSSAGARAMLATAPPPVPPHKDPPTVWGETPFPPSQSNAGNYAVLGDNDDDAHDDVDLDEPKSYGNAGGASAAAATGGGKPSLSAFKQKFKSKASEAAKVTAEWRARAAEKGTELSAKAKGAVADWESKAKERGSNAGRNGSPNGSGSVGADASSAIFGCSLAEAVERSKVGRFNATCGYPEHVVRALPAVFFRSIEALNVNGLEEVGIYRISGSTSEVTNIRSMFNSGQDVELVGQQIDCNAIASMFKAWLRELPESILTESVASQLSRLYQTSANDSVDPTTDTKLLAETHAIFAAASLPFITRCILYVLFGHLSLVASKESVNKMSVGNLQVIFCPTLGIGSQLFKVLVAEYEPLFGGVRTENPPPPVRAASRYSDGRPAATGGPGLPSAPAAPQKPARVRPSSTSASATLGSGSGAATTSLRPSSASESPSVMSYSVAPSTTAVWESVSTVPVTTARGVPPPTMRVSWGSAKDNFTGISESPLSSPTTASLVSPFSPVDGDAEGASVLGSLMDDMDPFADEVPSAAQQAPVLVPTVLHPGAAVVGGGGAAPVRPPRHHAPAFVGSGNTGGAGTGGSAGGVGAIWTPPRKGSLEYAPPGRAPQQPQQMQQQTFQQYQPHQQQQQPLQPAQFQNFTSQKPLDLQPPARFDSWKPSDPAS
ncbi:hypothetical protein HDU87_005816 [Geranomyces variabilis]|uniref:Rho-GAP domain-containing protein n=1 Tax=Geranomyces variabilis TaxID=109894 RepID=A0AAD5TGS5_9FUNG|nr:hypothetical protein HDU87_005816 [Geranomyces variabilis]